jgi:hypothetical protein
MTEFEKWLIAINNFIMYKAEGSVRFTEKLLLKAINAFNTARNYQGVMEWLFIILDDIRDAILEDELVWYPNLSEYYQLVDFNLHSPNHTA